MSIVLNIQSLCKEYDTTVPKLEKDLGFGKGSIYKWDKNSPSVDKLQKVADYFKVSTDYLLLGFEKTILIQFINSIKGERSIEQFSEDTGIEINELSQICSGQITSPPSNDTVEKIANSTMDFIPQRELDRRILLRSAGYRRIISSEDDDDFKNLSFKENQSSYKFIPKEEHDIARDLERMLSNLENNEALAFDGEPLDDETKELMKISLENSMRLAKQLAKKKFTPKKYK